MGSHGRERLVCSNIELAHYLLHMCSLQLTTKNSLAALTITLKSMVVSLNRSRSLCIQLVDMRLING